MRDRETFYARKFLNNDERGGIALVEASIQELSTRRVKTEEISFDATLKIGDCNRIIELDFGCWDKKDVAVIRQKITTLRRTIVAFEAILLAQLTEVEKT